MDKAKAKRDPQGGGDATTPEVGSTKTRVTRGSAVEDASKTETPKRATRGSAALNQTLQNSSTKSVTPSRTTRGSASATKVTESGPSKSETPTRTTRGSSSTTEIPKSETPKRNTRGSASVTTESVSASKKGSSSLVFETTKRVARGSATSSESTSSPVRTRRGGAATEPSTPEPGSSQSSVMSLPSTPVPKTEKEKAAWAKYKDQFQHLCDMMKNEGMEVVVMSKHGDEGEQLDDEETDNSKDQEDQQTHESPEKTMKDDTDGKVETQVGTQGGEQAVMLEEEEDVDQAVDDADESSDRGSNEKDISTTLDTAESEISDKQNVSEDKQENSSGENSQGRVDNSGTNSETPEDETSKGIENRPSTTLQTNISSFSSPDKAKTPATGKKRGRPRKSEATTSSGQEAKKTPKVVTIKQEPIDNEYDHSVDRKWSRKKDSLTCDYCQREFVLECLLERHVRSCKKAPKMEFISPRERALVRRNMQEEKAKALMAKVTAELLEEIANTEEGAGVEVEVTQKSVSAQEGEGSREEEDFEDEDDDGARELSGKRKRDDGDWSPGAGQQKKRAKKIMPATKTILLGEKGSPVMQKKISIVVKKTLESAKTASVSEKMTSILNLQQAKVIMMGAGTDEQEYNLDSQGNDLDTLVEAMETAEGLEKMAAQVSASVQQQQAQNQTSTLVFMGDENGEGDNEGTIDQDQAHTGGKSEEISMHEVEFVPVISNVAELDQYDIAELRKSGIVSESRLNTMLKGLDPESVECKLCKKRFKEHKYLVRHMIVHSNSKKKFKCKLCQKAFTRKYDLHVHLIRVHNWVKLGRGKVQTEEEMEEGEVVVKKRVKIGKKDKEIARRQLQLEKAKREGTEKQGDTEQPGTEKQGEAEEPGTDKQGEVEQPGTEKQGEAEQPEEEVQEEGETNTEKKVQTVDDPEDDEDDDEEEEEEDLDEVECDEDYPEDYFACLSDNIKHGPCKYCDEELAGDKMVDLVRHHEEKHVELKPFTCNFCDMAFEKFKTLHRHYLYYHAPKNYICEICDKKFRLKRNLLNHQKIHSTVRQWLCDYCGKGFSLQKYLQKHKIRHENEPDIAGAKKYTCQICKENFEWLPEYQTHMKSHKDLELRTFHCDQCPKSFFKLAHLKRHLLTHTSDRPFLCSYADCGKRYKDPDTLRKHEKYVHILNPEERLEVKVQHPCDECGKMFYNTAHLKRHKFRHTGERPFSCEHCGKAFAEKKSLENHVRIHTGVRPYACEDCGRRFIQISHLNRHKFLHTQVRNFECPECKKRFFEKADVEKHIRIHSKIRPFKCDLCDMTFSQRNILICHRRRHTGEKPYICDICSRSFTQLGSLQTHRRLHTGERPYRCQYCNMGFVSRERMKFHTYVHTGITPHICHICGKGFRLKFKLQSHLDSHEGVFRYKCDLCDKGFLERSKLNRHVRQVHNEDYPDRRIINYTGSVVKVERQSPAEELEEQEAGEGEDGLMHQEIIIQNLGHFDMKDGNEEVIETTYVVEGQDHEANNAISHITLEGSDAEQTAANLAALYESTGSSSINIPQDSIIYADAGEVGGEEVVYVVIPEENQTVILS